MPERTLLIVEGLDYLLSGEHALPALVLLDIKLPRVDGLKFPARLNKAWGPSLKGLKVVVPSSSFEPAERARAETLGARRFLRKPIGAEETAAMARELEALLAEA
jgi:CheY-like chemotaxis protein